MQKKILWLAVLSTPIALFFPTQLARAHESITVGDYQLVVGWASEPPVAGQRNAIELRVSDTGTGTEQPVEDISALRMTVSYGGQQKSLTLEPLGEDSPGEFSAPIVPTVAGEYRLTFGGRLGDTPVDAETHVQEVQPAETLAFPSLDATSPETSAFGLTGWLAIAGLLSGLAGLALSIFSLRRHS
jgi:hypothetical protein